MPAEGVRPQLDPGVAREGEREHRGSADGSRAAHRLHDEEERGDAEPDEGDTHSEDPTTSALPPQRGIQDR